MRRYLVLIAVLTTIAALSGCSGDHNPIVRVDSAMPMSAAAGAVPADAVIDSARFYLHVNATDTQSVQIHQVNMDWNEGDVTFSSFAAAFEPTALATVLIEDTGWYAVDISSQVQGWFDSTIENFGFFIQPLDSDTGVSTIDSREAAANQPYLEVFYTTHEGESVEMLDDVADAYIYSADPEINYGTEVNLIVQREIGVDSVYQSLVRFEFPVEIRYSSLGDWVWMDDNADGIQDDGEAGFAGVTVNLYDCADNLLATTTTDGSGNYRFDMLIAGDYLLEFVEPEDHLFSPADVGDDGLDSDVDPANGRTGCITILPGVDHTSWDAGLYPAPASVGDFAWNDENMNGLQDEGEVGMAGIEVHLYACGGAWLAMTTTDESGMYLFENLDAGDYYLKFVNPFGYIFTYQDEGEDDAVDSDVDRYQKHTVCFTLEPGDSITVWDAGLFAFEGCTYGKGYWKNHAGFGPQADELSKLLPIWLGDDDGSKSLQVVNAQMAVALLQQHEYGHPSNGITKMYAHLLTAKLNIVNFANPEDIHEAIAAADAFLANHDWMDWEMLSKAEQKMVLQWKHMFEQYDEGEIGPGHCDEDGCDE